MATHRIPVLSNVKPEAGVPLSLVGSQITAATAPSVANQFCYVLSDAGADRGFNFNFSIPKNYVGAPALIARGILDGAPGASDTLGLGLRKRAVADNEAADGTFDAEQVAAPTIGSGGSDHANEDEIEVSISLTAGDYAVDDMVYGYFFIDASGTSYAGNFLLTGLYFQYTDA
jgi:hypothetical protein